MPSHADKTPENKSKSVAGQPAQKKGGSEAISQFVDNRPEAQQRDRIQGMMNNNPQSRKAAQLQAMINQSPRALAQRQQIDRMFGNATQLLSGPGAVELQMKTEAAPVQRKDIDDDEMDDDDKPLQGKFATNEAPTQLQGEPGLQKNKTGLPDNVKAGVENLSGVSMDNVKVHYNSAKPARLNALAYTQGTDIHVGPGQEQHLPHEAWHVAQQKQGQVKPTMQMAGTQINDDAGLEHEADVMGAKATNVADNIPKAANKDQVKKDFKKENVSEAAVQQVADMAARVNQKRRLNKVKKDLAAAVVAAGNRFATVGEIDAHDGAQNAGVHHALRPVRLNQLIGDIDRTLAHLTGLNLRDSDALGVENKAGRGAGAVAIQL